MRMPKELYIEVFGKYVPRLCVDVIIYDRIKGVVWENRTIAPFIWNMPGGTMFRGETIFGAAIRLAKQDSGLDVSPVEILGVINLPDEQMEIDGTPIIMHNVMIQVSARAVGSDKTLPNCEWLRVAPFGPANMKHVEFLRERGFIP